MKNKTKKQVKSEIYKEENLTTENNNISFFYDKKPAG
jgi:hypothetical protein